jgi:hypothetical protein
LIGGAIAIPFIRFDQHGPYFSGSTSARRRRFLYNYWISFRVMNDRTLPGPTAFDLGMAWLPRCQENAASTSKEATPSSDGTRVVWGAEPNLDMQPHPTSYTF